MDDTVQLAYEFSANPAVIFLHHRLDLIKCRSFTVHKGTNLADFSDKLTDEGQRVASTLLAIRGVSSVSFDAYQLSVTKGAAFTWKELLPLFDKALKPITKHVGPMEAIQREAPPPKTVTDLTDTAFTYLLSLLAVNTGLTAVKPEDLEGTI